MLAILERNKAIYELKRSGLAIRQISRLTGICKTVIGDAKDY